VFASGTATNPSISFVSDSNTGIYSPGADQVAISTSGAGRLFVNSSGNVGIGTSSPSQLLHAQVFSANTVFLGSHNNTGVDLYANDSTGEARLTAKRLGGTGGKFLSFYTDTGSAEFERARIDSSGRLGIGTSSPNERLHVVGNARFTASLLWSGSTVTNAFIDGATTDVLRFGTQDTERLRIDSSGRVGIGTSSPSEPLSISASSNAFISITNSTAAKTNYIGTNSSGDLDLNGNGSQIILFKTAGIERLRIDSSGRLLVGTSTARANFDNSSESAVLQIEGTTNQSRRAAIISSIADVAGGNLTLAHQRSGTIGGNTILQDADTTGAITFQGSDGTEFVPAGSIACQVDGIPGANDMPGRLVFSTTADGASSPMERMRIKNNGLVCIACTDRIDTSTNASGFNYFPGDFVCVATTVGANACAIFNKTNSAAGLIIAIRYNGVDVGSITNTSTSTAYNTSSDYRLKENVVPLTGAIDRINQLKPSQFNFIADPDRIVDGFLAHEAQEVVPECVTGEKDAVDDKGNPIYQGIDQSKMVPLAIAAIQEAIAKIKTLEAKVAALEGV
jgi:hypothetical protein